MSTGRTIAESFAAATGLCARDLERGAETHRRAVDRAGAVIDRWGAEPFIAALRERGYRVEAGDDGSAALWLAAVMADARRTP